MLNKGIVCYLDGDFGAAVEVEQTPAEEEAVPEEAVPEEERATSARESVSIAEMEACLENGNSFNRYVASISFAKVDPSVATAATFDLLYRPRAHTCHRPLSSFFFTPSLPPSSPFLPIPRPFHSNQSLIDICILIDYFLVSPLAPVVCYDSI